MSQPVRGRLAVRPTDRNQGGPRPFQIRPIALRDRRFAAPEERRTALARRETSLVDGAHRLGRLPTLARLGSVVARRRQARPGSRSRAAALRRSAIGRAHDPPRRSGDRGVRRSDGVPRRRALARPQPAVPAVRAGQPNTRRSSPILRRRSRGRSGPYRTEAPDATPRLVPHRQALARAVDAEPDHDAAVRALRLVQPDRGDAVAPEQFRRDDLLGRHHDPLPGWPPGPTAATATRPPTAADRHRGLRFGRPPRPTRPEPSMHVRMKFVDRTVGRPPDSGRGTDRTARAAGSSAAPRALRWSPPSCGPSRHGRRAGPGSRRAGVADAGPPAGGCGARRLGPSGRGRCRVRSGQPWPALGAGRSASCVRLAGRRPTGRRTLSGAGERTGQRGQAARVRMSYPGRPEVRRPSPGPRLRSDADEREGRADCSVSVTEAGEVT